MEPLRPFEEELIKEFKPPEGYEMKRPSRGAVKSRTGFWIRDHLLDVGQDSITGMWERRSDFISIAKSMGVMIRDSQYRSFWSYVYILDVIKLIKCIRIEPGTKNPKFVQKYYAVVKANIDSTDWENPTPKYLATISVHPVYSSISFKKDPRKSWSELSSERTYKWRLSKPVGKPGRPRKYAHR